MGNEDLPEWQPIDSAPIPLRRMRVPPEWLDGSAIPPCPCGKPAQWQWVYEKRFYEGGLDVVKESLSFGSTLTLCDACYAIPRHRRNDYRYHYKRIENGVSYWKLEAERKE